MPGAFSLEAVMVSLATFLVFSSKRMSVGHVTNHTPVCFVTNVDKLDTANEN